MNNVTFAIRGAVGSYLYYATLMSLGPDWLDVDDREYHVGQMDALQDILTRVDGELVQNTWARGEQLANEIRRDHPDWVDPMEAELEEGDPYSELSEEYTDRIVSELLEGVL